jgi:hypothetical protein
MTDAFRDTEKAYTSESKLQRFTGLQFQNEHG